MEHRLVSTPMCRRWAIALLLGPSGGAWQIMYCVPSLFLGRIREHDSPIGFVVHSNDRCSCGCRLGTVLPVSRVPAGELAQEFYKELLATSRLLESFHHIQVGADW